jgi:hypothetical protein
MIFRRALETLTVFCWSAAPAFALQPPPGQGGFVPVDQLPASDQLPSAPLLIGAYVFVWLAVMFYVWSIWRRLEKVEADMRALEQKNRR